MHPFQRNLGRIIVFTHLVELLFATGCLQTTQSFDSGKANTPPATTSQDATATEPVQNTKNTSTETLTDYSALRPSSLKNSSTAAQPSSAPTGSQAKSIADDFEYFDPPLSQVGGPKFMSLYDQNDPELAKYNVTGSYFKLLPNGKPADSNLCGPVSAAMILDGVMNRIQTVKGTLPQPYMPIDGSTCIESDCPAKGWVSLYFQNANAYMRIANIAALVGPLGTFCLLGIEDPLNSIACAGTELSNVNRAVPNLASLGNFGSNSDGDTVPVYNYTLPLDQSTLVRLMKDNPSSPTKAYAILVKYGHYYAKVTKQAGNIYVNYLRKGGHFIVLSGHYTDSNGSQWFVVHDPWTLDQSGKKIPQVLKKYQTLSFGNDSTVSVRSSSGTLSNEFVIKKKLCNAKWPSGSTMTSTEKLECGNTTFANTSVGMGYIKTISTSNFPPEPDDYYAIIEGYARMSAPIR